MMSIAYLTNVHKINTKLEILKTKQKFVKKHSCIDPGIKFLANFRMQTIFPRPGGGTIAAGNRDQPSEKVAKREPKGRAHLIEMATFWEPFSTNNLS